MLVCWPQNPSNQKEWEELLAALDPTDPMYEVNREWIESERSLFLAMSTASG